jgi:acetyl-CoA carboxylase biotin carboxylase subunit
MRKVLVANRGEIALRVMRSIRNAGMSPVAVYSEIDRNALHVRMADKAYPIGPSPAAESYLRIERLIEAARKSGASAVHPGYGFLSENAAFAKACEAAGLVFIGPTSEAIAAMGDKLVARQHAREAGLSMTPASGAVTDPADAAREADRIGYPVLLKAKAGGGGKGMRRVNSPSEFREAFALAQSEATKAFHDGTMYLEKYVVKPRHVEVQIFGDRQGNAVAIGDRECSIQRRHQKIIEEALAPNLSEKTRRAMWEAATNLCRKVGYLGAGTVEFLVDADENFYFLEVNTRLQVEHPVSEWLTGLDFVRWQLDIAFDGSLPLRQEEIVFRGHAIEVRIYAEDPYNNFFPSPGKISILEWPTGPGIRIDTGVEQGSEVSLYYDPLIAKLSVWGADRDESLSRLLRALGEMRLGGLKTNAWYLQGILSHPKFRAGRLTTTFIEEEGPFDLPTDDPLEIDAMLASLAVHFRKTAPRAAVAREASSVWWASGLPANRLRRDA